MRQRESIFLFLRIQGVHLQLPSNTHHMPRTAFFGGRGSGNLRETGAWKWNVPRIAFDAQAILAEAFTFRVRVGGPPGRIIQIEMTLTH